MRVNRNTYKLWLTQKYYFFQNAEATCCKHFLCSWMNMCLFYTGTILLADSAFPLLKPQVSESIIQKCQATHEGWWFIKFSKCIPYVTGLLERVRADIWSKDLTCPVKSWLQQLQAIALPIGQSELLTGLVDCVQVKELSSFNISVNWQVQFSTVAVVNPIRNKVK